MSRRLQTRTFSGEGQIQRGVHSLSTRRLLQGVHHIQATELLNPLTLSTTHPPTAPHCQPVATNTTTPRRSLLGFLFQGILAGRAALVIEVWD